MVKHDDLDDLGIFHCHGGTPSSLGMVFVNGQIPSFDSWMMFLGVPLWLRKPPFKGYGNFDAWSVAGGMAGGVCAALLVGPWRSEECQAEWSRPSSFGPTNSYFHGWIPAPVHTKHPLNDPNGMWKVPVQKTMVSLNGCLVWTGDNHNILLTSNTIISTRWCPPS